MSGLLIPRGATRLEGLRTAAKPAVHATDTDDFVTDEQIKEQVEQFLNYTGSVPEPMGWTVMILILGLPEVTEGGLIMEDEFRAQKTHASPQGVVIQMGAVAYNPEDPRFPTGKWCKKGDRVLYGRYTGKPFRLANGQNLAFLVDTDIIGVVESGWLGDDA